VPKLTVGLKIGASQLTAACLEVNGSARLVQVARDPLPGGVVVGGEVRDVPALAEALKAFFKRHGLPRKNVRIGIANNRIGVRTLDITGIDDARQLGNAVRFRAQEALPIPVHEALLDFQLLSEGADAEGAPTKRVLLVVAYKDLVDAYAQACVDAGLRLAGVDLEAFALLRALTPPANLGMIDRSALVAVAIGAERSTLAVSDGFTCEFTRVLEWGGAALTGALSRGLELDPEAAEELKRKMSLEAGHVPDDVTIEEATMAREALRGALHAFARELVSSLQFYQSQPDSLGIREIVLAGGTAQLGGLAAALEQLVGVSVRVGDPLVGVSVARKVKGDAPPVSLAVPIGLGMAI
jgi:type IV pilus assembly protein PilM